MQLIRGHCDIQFKGNQYIWKNEKKEQLVTLTVGALWEHCYCNSTSVYSRLTRIVSKAQNFFSLLLVLHLFSSYLGGCFCFCFCFMVIPDAAPLSCFAEIVFVFLTKALPPPPLFILSGKWTPDSFLTVIRNKILQLMHIPIVSALL